jgi:serine/threonine-protein phosphatase PGAM5
MLDAAKVLRKLRDLFWLQLFAVDRKNSVPFNIVMEFEPKIYRTIVFIRHGQYFGEPERLTTLGRKQAALVAKAIKPLGVSKLHCSSMPRAIETANIICQQVGLKFKPKDIFREGFLPGTIGYDKMKLKKATPGEKVKLRLKMRIAKKNADKAFQFLFKTPQRGQSTEVVVAHGNVIRHWVCKALKISEEKWLSMDVSHTSITTIRLSKSGNFVLLGFSDNGHLPHKMRTYV